jgi:predicted O-methyltransferase YrrM
MDGIYQALKRKLANRIEAGQVVVHRDPSAEAMKRLEDESVDFVYVDGDHSYEGVASDLAAAFRVTKPGGVICCDDYILGAWWKDGVVRAVHEFLCSKPVVIDTKADTQIMIRKLASP